MAKKIKNLSIFSVIVLSISITAIAFVIPLISTGERNISTIENIYGIPYPQTGEATVITEELAHADIYLKEPVLFKKIRLTVTFDPKDATTLALGIRENDFWLSYTAQNIYNANTDLRGKQTKTVTIPLTDKFQETNQSLDMMIFNNSNQVEWELYDIQAEVIHDIVGPKTVKQYIASIIKRERAQ